MSLIFGTATAPTSSTAVAFYLPAGLCNYTIFQPAGQTTVYVGSSPNVSSTNGLPVPVTPVSSDSYVAGKGITYYVTTGGVAASSFCYVISTAN
jgi:hypothetical protein